MAWRMEVALLIGVQGAGKTSFCTEHLVHSHLRISRDLVRTRHREQVLFQTCLDLQQPVVIDNTNPSVEVRARFLGPALARDVPVVAYWIVAPLVDALERNAGREGDARIPDHVLRRVHRELVAPSLAEGFERIVEVHVEQGRGFVLRPRA
ncbi:AAA family ATPase [Nannocystaceae bacterium ST9]